MNRFSMLGRLVARRAVAATFPVIAIISFTIVAALLFVTDASVAQAQHPGAPGSAPALPTGDGTLTVHVDHATSPSESAGIEIVLYALSSDGTPGLANGETDADGLARFASLSTDPGIVYLIGARYQGIPFGERVTFGAGENTIDVHIDIMSPTDQTTGVAVEEIRLRIDWVGDRVVIREILRVTNPGERVIQLQDTGLKRSIFTRPLPAEAADFSSGPNGVDDGIRLEDGAVQFKGPLYPGDQSVEFRYSLPVSNQGGPLTVPIELDQAAGRIVVVAGTTGLKAAGSELIASKNLQSDSGQSLSSWARAGLAADERFELNLTLPESRLDRSLMTLSRSDLWIEVDDTQLTATVDIQIEVAPGAPIAGTLDAPLLHITIPEGATMQGVAPEAEALGLIPIEGGGFDVVGPIASGTTSLGYSYRMPTQPSGVQLDMRFPGEIETLNVLIADTGLALDSSRLHRRRPFRSGTRNYLHREAFNIGRDEIVDLELVPLRAEGIPRNASAALMIAAAAAGAFFMFGPLRVATRARQAESQASKTVIAIQAKRERVYSAIDDLDHDFETAKLDEADYAEMRERLRAEAIELLRAERAVDQPGSTPAQQPTPNTLDGIASSAMGSASIAAGTTPQTGPQTASALPATGAFCPSCGGNVLSSWRFCTHCGGGLNPPADSNG